MFIQFYLYAIKSVHVKNHPKKNVLYHIIKSYRWLQRLMVLNRRYDADIIVWIYDKSHLKQLTNICLQLKQKGLKILFIAPRRDLLSHPDLVGYQQVFFPLPSHQQLKHATIHKFMQSFKQAQQIADVQSFSSEDYILIEKCFREWGGYTRSMLRIMDKFVSQTNAKAAIIGYDIPTEGRIFTMTCNQHNLPTFMVQHGSVAIKDGIFSGHIASHYMIYGNLTYNILKSVECKSQPYITGPPYLDYLHHKKNSLKRGSHHSKNILIAFSGAGHFTTLSHHVNIIQLITELVQSHPHICFYFKFHPKDKELHYTHLRVFNNVFFELPHSNSKDIFDWILHCDLVITGASTVAQEAMICGVPAISLDLENAYETVEFIKDHSVYYVTNKQALTNTVNQLLNGIESTEVKENAAKHVKHFYGQLDGEATQRCTDIIMNIIHKHTR